MFGRDEETIALALCGSQGLAGLCESHRSTPTLTAARGEVRNQGNRFWFESAGEAVPVLAVRQNSKTQADWRVI
jgi:hypothetical protein